LEAGSPPGAGLIEKSSGKAEADDGHALEPLLMITATESAVKHLRELLLAHAAGEGSGLRLAVRRGGCAGLEYAMNVDAPGSGDRVFDHDGVRIIVDEASLPLLDNSCIDYSDSLADAGFKVVNPNAARSCGCGTSFEPKPA
jgi:iron-sulfur cluster assembly accessory protein